MRLKEIDRYIFDVIVPKYSEFDSAHREDHALTVIEQAMKLLDGMNKWEQNQENREWNVPVDRTVLKMAAACHDLGLVNGRERHHLDSGEIIRQDENLKRWFTADEIETIVHQVRMNLVAYMESWWLKRIE